MSSPAFEAMPPDADTRQKLDIAVDRASLAYFEALLLPGGGTDQPGLNSLGGYLLNLDDRFLELVFVSDARAKVEENAPGHDEELAWVEAARQGLRRSARHKRTMVGLDRARLFATGQEGPQRLAYYDMCGRRVMRGTFELDAATTYADRVVSGEIGLGVQVSQSRN